MTLTPSRVMVTGGAGFIGSHIVDRLVMLGADVVLYDNFSTGFRQYADPRQTSGKVRVVEGDILDPARLTQAMEGVSRVFHLAANADVRGGKDNTHIDLEQNVIGTHRVLEAMRIVGVPEIVFTSSATVYGEPDVFPTPEDYAPLQTSLYGASKLAAEGIIQAYGEYYGIRSLIFRFVSWVGERYSHGVVYDFIQKLQSNPRELLILGDGRQRKSYLHVDDGLEGIFLALEKAKDRKNVFNLGHVDFMNVTDLADIVCDEMGLHSVEYRYAGGTRGWLGDSPFVHLDVSRIAALGFRPQVTIEEGIRRTARYLLNNPWLLAARSR